jgi:urate oxidase
VLKTTQSGYAGFLRCPLTVLPEVHERMLATSVTATWRYNGVPNTATSDASYDAVVGAFKEKFFGPATKGVYSPAVQTTIYQVG